MLHRLSREPIRRPPASGRPDPDLARIVVTLLVLALAGGNHAVAAALANAVAGHALGSATGRRD
jgi:hypothetical protein